MLFLHHGIVRGRNIELEQETGLPDGSAVSVRIERRPLPLDELRMAVRSLCGAWRDDDSLDEVFAEIWCERAVRGPRDITFDDPS
jgi:hypothetical protein